MSGIQSTSLFVQPVPDAPPADVAQDRSAGGAAPRKPLTASRRDHPLSYFALMTLRFSGIETPSGGTIRPQRTPAVSDETRRARRDLMESQAHRIKAALSDVSTIEVAEPANKQAVVSAVVQLITAAEGKSESGRPESEPGSGSGSEWKPLAKVRATLDQIETFVANADAQTKAATRAELLNALAKPDHSRPEDLKLLAKIITRIIDGTSLSTALGDIAEESLKLPNFKLRAADGAEPSERDFTSTLLPFASAAYDYGPLGRTLLLEGARVCFAGPSLNQRAQKLQDAMFALPNPPESGQPLETMADIWSALREKGIDV